MDSTFERKNQFSCVLKELSLLKDSKLNKKRDDGGNASSSDEGMAKSHLSKESSPGYVLVEDLKKKVIAVPHKPYSKTSTYQNTQNSSFITVKTLHEAIQSLRPVYRCRDIAIYDNMVLAAKASRQKSFRNLKRCHLTVKCATAATFPRREKLDGAFISTAELEMAIKLLKPLPDGDKKDLASFEDEKTKSQFIDLKPGLPISREEFDSAINNLRKVGDTKYPSLRKSFYQDIGVVPVDDVATGETLDIDTCTSRVNDKKNKKKKFLSRLKFWKQTTNRSTRSTRSQRLETPDVVHTTNEDDQKTTYKRSFISYFFCCFRNK